MSTMPSTGREGPGILKVPRMTLVLSVIVLISLIVFVYLHVGDARRFIDVLERTEPQWLILVVVLQVNTYVCIGLIWNRILRSAGHRIHLRELTRLSVEKLSIDQLIPAVGISGNIAVYQAMKRLGVPQVLAMEAILINLLGRYIAFAIAAIVAVGLLWAWHDITPVLMGLVVLFAVVLIIVPMVILWMLAHQSRPLPRWMKKLKPLVATKELVDAVSPQRVYSWPLLSFATVFNLIVFLLDSGTLWAVLHSVGLQSGYLLAYVALVMASVAATLSLLPGGIGGFEAGCVAMLTMMGDPVETALTGTILLRGITLWLPLIPGLLFARKDVLIKL